VIPYLIAQAVLVAVPLLIVGRRKRHALRDSRELRELDDWLNQIRDTTDERTS
jgi:hypothetical protein